MKVAACILLTAALALTACHSEQNSSASEYFNVPEGKDVSQKKPPANVATMISEEKNLDNQCRQGNENNPETWEICGDRDALLMQIAKLGWCWGSKKEGAAADELDWLPCSENAHGRARGRDLGFW